MIVNKYRTELNEDKLNVLVKESSAQYDYYEDVASPEKIEHLMNTIYNVRNLAEEHCYLIALDVKLRVIGVFEISHGTVDYSAMSARSIFIRALLCGAAKIVLVHNHPSGVTKPSSQDISITEKINELGKLLEIELVDHIIIGDRYFSFNEENYL